MFIEKLWIIEKGGGCCWTKNHRQIKKNKKNERKKTWDREPVTPQRAHAQAHALLVRSGEENSQQCTGRDGNHSFYKAHVDVGYMYGGEGFFIGTAKAIRCSS